MSFIEHIQHLRDYIDISDFEAEEINDVASRYPWRITSYYAALMDSADQKCPVRRQAVPGIEELSDCIEDSDPLFEEQHSPVPGIIRVYPDRVAVVLTGRCPVYCRFCLRKRFSRAESEDLRGIRLENVLSYIRNDTAIRDVLLTGGDPFILSDSHIDDILVQLRKIQHVEIVRIGTRTPCTWPERITEDLADILASHHPLWVNTQFNHPKEVTEKVSRAIDILLKRGIPIGNQSVLLRGVNDSAEIMKELLQKLVRIRIRPYYLYQAQHLAGTGHFVTAIEDGIAIIRQIRGWTTGFSVPQYVLDTPYGKVPINPEYLMGREGDEMVMQSFDGKIWREKNPLIKDSEQISKEHWHL